MFIKALVSFSGKVSMFKGQIMACEDEKMLQDLLQAGHVEKLSKNKSKKDVKPIESK